MMKKDWKKQLKRVRDIADKNFTRSEKPEQLNDSLMKLEQRIDNIKHVCHAVGKKLLACLQLHGVEPDKRSKKLPESALSKQLHESSAPFEESDVFRRMLVLCGGVEDDLANRLVGYEDEIESKVLLPLQNLLEKDIPNIVRLRKQVAKQAQEVETLKSRHSTMQRQSLSPQDAAKKINQAQEDVEEASAKLELYKDQLATEMYNFRAKEGELNKIFISLIDLQLRYHTEAATTLSNVLPNIRLLEESTQRPVYGCSLEDHLRQMKQPIASVIRDCIDALLSEGMQLEGLFRIAGGATKLKKLKAAFDAGMVEMEEYILDPHCIAGALKQYLRELPEPLMTFELYDDWAEAASLPVEQRIQAIENILKKMRKPHFDNLKYLVKFLARLAENVETNKMSASNLAIVIGPNLLWSRSGDGQNILAPGVQNSITETMISNAFRLFGDDLEFGMTSCDVTSSQTSVAASGREVNSSTKQTMAKADSSDSLSSDSLGADSAVVTHTSSSEVASLTRSSEADVTNLVPPKRNAKKLQAPRPPPPDSTIQADKPATLVSTKPPVTSADPEEIGDSLGAAKATSSHSKVSVQSSVASSIGETDSGQKKAMSTVDPSSSNQGAVTSEDEKLTSKKTTQFAANQALISNILSGPRKTFLTRPNTTYMDTAKIELLKTAEEQNDEATPLQKSEVNGTVTSGGKGTDAGDARGARHDPGETSSTEASPDGGAVGNVELDEEEKLGTQKMPSQQKTDGEECLRKPERPSKPVRPSPSDSDAVASASKSEASVKTSPDEPKREPPGVKTGAVPRQMSHDEFPTASSTSQNAGTVPAKNGRAAPADLPTPGQQGSGGGGTRPPKPPPPAVATTRSPSTSNVDENTHL